MATPEVRTSHLLVALERLWTSIQDHHPDVPPVMFAIGEGSGRGPASNKPMLLGRFAPKRWQLVGQDDTARLHEIFVAGEQLHDAVETLDTMLHEAAHAVARDRGVQDVSRDKRYHNKRFKAIAEELGLVVGKDKKLGYQNTTVLPLTVARFQAELEALTAAMGAYRLPEPTREAQRPVKPSPPGQRDSSPMDGEEDDVDGTEEGQVELKGRVTLSCQCPRRILVSASVWRLGPILCRACRQDFTLNGKAQP